MARFVLYQYSRTSPPSSDELIKQFHWLPTIWRIRLKLVTLNFKALHTGRPSYLSGLLQHQVPTRSLSSSSFHQLSIPRHILTFWSRAFRFSAPRLWNSLLLVSIRSIRESKSLQTSYKDSLLLVSLYPLSASLLACILILPRALIFLRLWRYINHVLTYLIKISMMSMPCTVGVKYLKRVINA